jgi:putative ABC transport system permease protein
MSTFFQDLRYGIRMLAKSPAFTAVAALTLALGIGASTAIFSAVNPILFEPLPYPQAGRIMMIWDIFQGSRSDVTFHTYRELAQRSRSFDVIAVMEPWQPTITGPAEPERLDGQSVSANYFRVLGVAPALGRDFRASDDQFRGPKLEMLSDGLWRRRFLGDRAIVGRQITLDGDLYTVIGVMPRWFENVLAPSAEIWSPMQYDPQHITTLDTTEWGHHLRMAGRLRPGVSKDQARRDLEAIAHTPVPEFPRARWASLEYGLILDSLQDDVTRGVKPALLAVLGAVMLVLTIACANVTNLLLGRGAQRHGEFAMRATLGAGRPRLIRQLLTESLLLAGLGGALAMEVADFGVRALVALSPPGLPRVGAIEVNGAVFAFALGITTVVGLAVGLIPALHASSGDLHAGLQQSSQRTAGGHQGTRRTLVVAEVALALVLLVGAGLLLRSLERLLAVDPGFDPSHRLTMQVQTSGHQFDDLASAPDVGASARHRFFAQALEAVRRVPGVKAAAFTSLLPLTDDSQFGTYGMLFEDGNGYNVFRYAVSPGYIETMGIPLGRGRLLDDHDAAGTPPVVLISESLAKREFHGQDPIGKRVHVGPIDRPWYTVVGVVGDVRQASLAESDPDAVYLTASQSWFADEAMSLVVTARSDAAALAPAIRKAIWSVDKDQPIVRVATMDDLLAASAAERHFALVLFEVFGVVALALAAAGIYGVLSANVTERTREIGIRSVLGASPRSILAAVVRQGIALTGLGLVIGLVGAAAASRALITLLFGISQLDPITYFGVVALLLAVALLASYVPARRATKVDPMVALRYE